MKMTFFVAAALVGLLAACKKEGAKCCPAGQGDSAAAMSDSATDSAASELFLDPSPEQIAKAHRVGNKHCPTDGEKLGAMGKPISVIYKGELVELCCAGCPKEFGNDPDKYLAIAKADTAAN
ncbi:MAG: hypothetical protein RL173_2576 [Fibrobacterota bacterium]|jgi:hypothetical protein